MVARFVAGARCALTSSELERVSATARLPVGQMPTAQVREHVVTRGHGFVAPAV